MLVWREVCVQFRHFEVLFVEIYCVRGHDDNDRNKRKATSIIHAGRVSVDFPQKFDVAITK